jgi:hypothetical protein
MAREGDRGVHGAYNNRPELQGVEVGKEVGREWSGGSMGTMKEERGSSECGDNG